MSLRHFHWPQNEEMFKKQLTFKVTKSQIEGTPIGQIWDNFSIKIKNGTYKIITEIIDYNPLNKIKSSSLCGIKQITE